MQTLHRLRLCAVLCLAPTAPIAARLIKLQVLQHRAFSSRVQNETERYSLEIIPRGRILDRQGLVLAQSLPSWSSYIDLNALKEPRALARSIAPILGMSAAEVLAKTKGARRTEWLKRKMSLEETTRLKALKLASVGIVPDEQRFYPNGTLARPVLGSVGGEGKGNGGLELAYDKRLSGRSHKVELTRDGSGHAILQDPQKQIAPPPDLRLTLDRAIQFFAESAIEDTVRQYQAKRGMVLVQDPKTGEILAMASYPADPLRNAAIQDIYEPGSTFKIVIAAAALENRTVSLSEKIDCEGGRWQITDKVAIKDHEPQGRLNLAEIISHSSNVGSGKIGLRMGAGPFERFCRLFGFGYKTGIPFPAESAGLLRIPESSDPVRLANAAFGQGVAVTPLQMIGAYSAVANGGTLMEPRLVLETGSQSAPLRVRRVMGPQTAETLRSMLELVVQKGTGVSAQVPGYRTAGKTGTAQKLDPATGRYSPTDYISSFAGYAPAGDPRFAVLVIVDSPRGKYYGAEVAAPVFARLMRQILPLRGVPPDLPLPFRPSAKGLPRPSILKPAG